MTICVVMAFKGINKLNIPLKLYVTFFNRVYVFMQHTFKAYMPGIEYH